MPAQFIDQGGGPKLLFTQMGKLAWHPNCCCGEICTNCSGNEIISANVDITVPQGNPSGICSGSNCQDTIVVQWPAGGDCTCARKFSQPPFTCPAAGFDHDFWDVCVNEDIVGLGGAGDRFITVHYRRFGDPGDPAKADYHWVYGVCNGDNDFTPTPVTLPINCALTYTLHLWQAPTEIADFCDWSPNPGFCVSGLATIDLSFNT